ncbi:MAG: GNAT family N-acetyltransferase [Pseudomonas sp.]|nr:GNAT family N-acetyltransferase [Pseudomonas sp.]
MEVIECSLKDVDRVAQLFNEYRVFYELADDLAASRGFIQGNLEKKASRVFLLLDDDQQPVAFAQLYPAICSLEMKPFYWLYDLYVAATARKKGFARALMTHLTTTLTAEGAQRISLDTAHANKAAQALYESLGYEREAQFITYHKILKP